MAAERWTFVLTKMDHTPIAEVINAYDRNLAMNLTKPSTASFTVRHDNPLLLNLFSEDTLLQVYQESTLRFWGPNVSANYVTQGDGSTPTIAVAAADPAWRLTKRLAGKSKTGTTYTTKDKGTTAREILAAANGEGETEIEEGAGTSGSTGTYTAGPYKPVLTCIEELAHGVDGFDWYIAPVTGTPTKIGKLVLDVVIGETKPNAIFEYGTGKKNMRNLNYLRDLGGILNRAYHLPDEGLEGTESVVVKEDAASQAARGLYEETIDLTGVTNKSLREQWAQNNIDIRSEPRRVLSMTSDVADSDNPDHIPIPGKDYWLGDLVTARAVVQEDDAILFNGLTRVYSIGVSLNNNGTAQISPVLVDEG
jgi:hypothetical protein